MALRSAVGFLSLIAGLAALGCSAPEDGEPPVDIPHPVEVSVTLGIPPPEDDLGFALLEDGDEIQLQSFGQGGTHALFSVRFVGFGNRAYVTITIINMNTQNQVVSPAMPRPQLLLCEEDGIACNLVPFLVMTGGLTAPDEERDGLPVELVAEASNEAGDDATSVQHAILRTDLL